MQITVNNPAKALVALALARTQLGTRYAQLANCRTCEEQVKQSYERSLPVIDELINQLQEALK